MESLILGSHNFLLFVILFTLSLALAVTTLLSYRRSILVYLNAGMFLICAIRTCTEFGMHLADSLSIIEQINTYNSIIAQMFYVLSWFLIYFYVRPFKSSKHSKIIDWVVSIFILIIPNLIIFYHFLTFQIFEFATIKIDGYWMFRLKSTSAQIFYQAYIFLFMAGIYTSSIMINSIVTSRSDRIKQLLLLFSFYAITQELSP